jgi:hypothetical protein
VRRVLALTVTAAAVLSFGVAVDADAAVTSPGNGSTVKGSVTVTESPGGHDGSTLSHCGGNTSTVLQLLNSGGTVVWSASNSGGTLNASLRTESFSNGSYTVRGTENNGANGSFLFNCKTNTSTFNNAITISNEKAITYTGDTSAVAGTGATVSAKVIDPNDGSAPLSGQAVTFSLSGGTTVSATTNASGVATATLPTTIPPRSATLTVSSPATSFFTAAGQPVPFTVKQIPTTTTATPQASAVHGQPVQFSASVSHNAGLDTTGQVQFVVDGQNFGSPVPVTSNSAVSAPTTTLSTGNHSVVAKYLGDANYATSASAAATQVVGQASTTTSLQTSVNPSTFGQSVTFTADVAIVAPGAGTPTGQVQFDVDGAPFGTAVSLSGTSASLTVSSLPAGNHTVSATYDGDADFARSTSADITQGVNLAQTSVSLESSADPSVSGQRVSFTATVDAVPPGVGTPTGAVQFSVDGNDIGAPVPLAGGTATSPSVPLLVGDHTVVANYQGSPNFAGAQGSFTQHVGRAATTTSVSSDPNPSVFGQPVTFKADVSVVAPGDGDPAGVVQFYVDGVASGNPVPLSGGSATSAAVSNLSTGDHQITASYLGGTEFQSSDSPAQTQTVNRARTATTLTSSANPAVWGQPVTLTATVAAVAPGAGNPTGTLTFSDGSTTLGSAHVGPDTGEQGSITTDALTVGAHAISVSYSGDDSFQPSSDALTQTVLRAQTSTVVISSANPAKSGQAVRFTALVSPVAPGAGQPSGTVTFTVNGAAIGSPVALSGGSATSTAFSSLSPGTYDIRATYSGDNHFVGSSAALDQSTGQTVSQGATTLALTATPNPAAFGDTVSFRTTVSAVAPATGTPSGVVDYYEGDQLVGAVSLVAAGDGSATAVFTSSTLSTGTHAITATYLGNYNFTGSSDSTSAVVGQVPTVTGLSVAPNPAVYGDTVTLTATVAASAGAPTGSVTFLDGSTVLGTTNLGTVQGSQQATLDVPGLHAGDHPLTAVYSGTPRYAGSTSVAVHETVQRAPSTLVARSFITQSPAFPDGFQIYGRVQATLTGNGGAPLPGETLVFTTTQTNTDGSVIHICTRTTDSHGSAECDATTLFPASTLDGGYDVTFNGDADYAPTTVHQVVNDR